MLAVLFVIGVPHANQVTPLQVTAGDSCPPTAVAHAVEQLRLPSSSSCAVVLADSGRPEGVALARRMVPEACRIFVYDKGGSNGEEDSPLSQRCQLPPMANMQCETLPNRGREFGSYIHYILENYDALPERIIFAPSNFGKHDREDGIRQLLEATVGHPSSVDDDAPTQTEMQSFWCMEHRSTCEGKLPWAIPV